MPRAKKGGKAAAPAAAVAAASTAPDMTSLSRLRNGTPVVYTFDDAGEIPGKIDRRTGPHKYNVRFCDGDLMEEMNFKDPTCKARVISEEEYKAMADAYNNRPSAEPADEDDDEDEQPPQKAGRKKKSKPSNDGKGKAASQNAGGKNKGDKATGKPAKADKPITAGSRDKGGSDGKPPAEDEQPPAEDKKQRKAKARDPPKRYSKQTGRAGKLKKPESDESSESEDEPYCDSQGGSDDEEEPVPKKGKNDKTGRKRAASAPKADAAKKLKRGGTAAAAKKGKKGEKAWEAELSKTTTVRPPDAFNLDQTIPDPFVRVLTHSNGTQTKQLVIHPHHVRSLKFVCSLCDDSMAWNTMGKHHNQCEMYKAGNHKVSVFPLQAVHVQNNEEDSGEAEA